MFSMRWVKVADQCLKSNDPDVNANGSMFCQQPEGLWAVG